MLLFIVNGLAISAQDTLKTVMVSTYHDKSLVKEKTVDENKMHYFVNACDKTSFISLTEEDNFSLVMNEAFSPQNILLFVHGDDFDLEKLAIRGADFPDLYNINTILFAWQSYRISHNSIKNYNNSKKNADLSFPYFLQLVDSIKNYAMKHQVKASVIFHSLGNIFAQKYALFLEDNPDTQQPFTNIILNSACVPAKDHVRWVDILCQKASNKVYVTVNKNDNILLLASTFIEHQHLLGRKIGRKTSQNAYYIDFTDILRNVSSDKKMPSSHTYFISYPPRENPEIKKFYNTLFHSNLYQDHYEK